VQTTAIDIGVSARSARRLLLQAASLACVLLVVAVWFVLLRPSSLGGPTTYVIVSGSSMQPALDSGDLVVAFEQDTYTVGDVVVYPVPAAAPGSETLIVHRIVGGLPSPGFVVKGDNREGADHWQPRADELLGKVRLTLPAVGTALFFLQQPPGIALLAAFLTFLIVLWTWRRPGTR
jgi:signal peptidase